MKLLEYYLEKQNDQDWYNNFFSSGKNSDGKLLSVFATTFRKLTSFMTQLKEFENKDGLRRKDWNDYQESGQESDKHRIVNLLNAGLIREENDAYFFTEKGREVLRLGANDSLSDNEKWVLLFMLIIDYRTKSRDLDLIKSVLELEIDLKSVGISAEELLLKLRMASQISEKSELFQSDIFWLITFRTDSEFLKLYISSPQEDKVALHDWVIQNMKDRKSKDLVAHKYVESGVYSLTTFLDEAKIALAVLILSATLAENWDGYLSIACKLYENTDIDHIHEFMNNNPSLYQSLYQKTFASIIQSINS